MIGRVVLYQKSKFSMQLQMHIVCLRYLMSYGASFVKKVCDCLRREAVVILLAVDFPSSLTDYRKIKRRLR